MASAFTSLASDPVPASTPGHPLRGRLPRVVFAGTPAFAERALDALLAEGQQVVGVLTQPDRPAGRGQKLTPSPVKRRAQAAGLPVLQPLTLRDPDAWQAVAALQPDVMVVAAYGLILPQAVLDIPRFGCLNIHASLLPRWRGAAPIVRAIQAGDRETGVCIMKMEAGLDTGPVAIRRVTPILPSDTAGSLHDRLAALGPDAVLRVLRDLERGQLQPMPQDHTQATKAPKLRKEDGTVDFHQPAARVRARIHGLTPWPGCRIAWRRGETDLGTLTIARVRDHAEEVTRLEPGTVLDGHRVAAVSGSIELIEVQAPGTRIMPVADFVRGRPILPGDYFAPLAEPAA